MLLMLPLLECLVFLLPESWKYLILLSELKDIAFLEFYWLMNFISLETPNINILLSLWTLKTIWLLISLNPEHMISCPTIYLRLIWKKEKKVEYICTDMSFIFKPLLKTYFPNSTLLVDHFHVTRLINDQLNHTRKRIMRKYAKNKNPENTDYWNIVTRYC